MRFSTKMTCYCSVAVIALMACGNSDGRKPQPTLASVMQNGETTGSQQPFFSNQHWIKNTGRSVTLDRFAANPAGYMRGGIAYDVLRTGVAIKLGRDNLSDAEFKTLLQSDSVGTRACEGTIITTGIDPVTGDAFWFERPCYANETIVYVMTSNGPIDLFSLGCGNLIDGLLFTPAPPPMVMDDDNFTPACIGDDCGPTPPPPPECEGEACDPVDPPVCTGPDCDPVEPPVCEENCTTPLRHAISFVMFTLADGTTVKIDEYSDEVKDPNDPAQYVSYIEELTGQTVQDGYVIKAGRGYYDENGNPVDPISHKADYEIDQADVDTGDTQTSTTANVTHSTIEAEQAQAVTPGRSGETPAAAHPRTEVGEANATPTHTRGRSGGVRQDMNRGRKNR